MTTPDYKALCAELADALDHNRQCLMDDRSLTHPLADRARAALAEGEAGPSKEAIDDLFFAHCYVDDFGNELMELPQFRKGARAVLVRYGSAPRPVPVSERPWERKEWCDARGLCWWSLGTTERWTLCRPHGRTVGWMLPAHAIPLPQESTDG